jgi:tRNA-dihydrouridine synthase B
MLKPVFKNLKLENPLIMAPMCGYTDRIYRKILRKHGAALCHTEMVSSASLVRGKDKGSKIMLLDNDEHPVAVQLFGSLPEEMSQAAKMVEQAGADCISINFGCPVPKVIKSNSGAALLKNPDKIFAITAAVVKNTGLPVIPKIRLGWDNNSINVIEVAERIQDAGASALVVHARTRSQGYSGEADWRQIALVKNFLKIPVIGNGDLFDPIQIYEKMQRSGVDAVMLGRGALGNPWIFSRSLCYLESGRLLPKPSTDEIIILLKKHLNQAFEWKGLPGLREMRKHCMYYCKGLPQAAALRAQINQCDKMEDLDFVFDQYLKSLKAQTVFAEIRS